MKIIVRLAGGIGNQIFQYAAGRSLAISHDYELCLDDSLLKQRRYGVTPRDYELDAYNIVARKLTPAEQAAVKPRVRRPLRYMYDIGLMKSPFYYYREPHFEFDHKLHQLSGNLIIEGYWQSERYFSDIANTLRRELQPINPPPSNMRDFLGQMTKNNSVSLHVRRGDYISNPKAAANHVSCDLAYYKRAAALVAERVSSPVFYVFSDDPEWVENELQIGFPMVLVSQPKSWPAYDDLRLMSHCAHHIIANSSFSWWGAWLNPSPDKIVIAPSRWFRVDKNIQDLIPPKWLVI